MELANNTPQQATRMVICHNRLKAEDLETIQSTKVYNLDDMVALAFNITPKQLFQKTRIQPIKDARFYYFYLLHKKFKMPITAIKILTGWHHASILHGCNRVQQYIDTEKAFRILDQNMMKLIKESGISIPADPRISKKAVIIYNLGE